MGRIVPLFNVCWGSAFHLNRTDLAGFRFLGARVRILGADVEVSVVPPVTVVLDDSRSTSPSYICLACLSKQWMRMAVSPKCCHCWKSCGQYGHIWVFFVDWYAFTGIRTSGASTGRVTGLVAGDQNDRLRFGFTLPSDWPRVSGTGVPDEIFIAGGVQSRSRSRSFAKICDKFDVIGSKEKMECNFLGLGVY